MPSRRQPNAASFDPTAEINPTAEFDPLAERVRGREVHPDRVRPGVCGRSTLVVAVDDWRASGGRPLEEGFSSDEGRSRARLSAEGRWPPGTPWQR